MSSELHSLENSLKEFLIETNSKGKVSGSGTFYKYNNLKMFMEPKQNSTPHFIIRIGMSEALYDLETGEKLSGSLGPDENAVRHWIKRNLFHFNLDDIWKEEKKVKQVIVKKDFYDI